MYTTAGDTFSTTCTTGLRREARSDDTKLKQINNAWLMALSQSCNNERHQAFISSGANSAVAGVLQRSSLRRKTMRLLGTAVLLFAVNALAAEDDAEPKKVAITYLNALTGSGDEAGKDLLLGGVTMNAQLFTLENWEIASKDPVHKEDGDLAHALQLMNEYDKAGRSALTKLLGVEAVGDDLKVIEVSQADAAKLLGPTREKAQAFEKAHKVLAHDALRVGKEVYWHPKNPMRAVLAKAGTTGKYTIEVHRWNVVSKEGAAKTPRTWPMRVMRFKSAKIDTGWKVIPASDWNAE